MGWLIAIAILLVLLFLGWASSDIGSGVYLRSRCRGRVQEQVVALTFDDGPHETMTERVLEVLDHYQVPATFFLVGEQIERHPERVRRLVAKGHTIGGHSYHHRPTFALQSYRAVSRELQLAEQAAERATGLKMRLFRPPFGVTNPTIGRAVRKAGYTVVGWSIRSLDTVMRRSREEVCRRVLKRLHPGAVILLHDRLPEADRLLEQLLVGLRERGYRVVPIEELLKIEVYEK